MQSPPDPRPRRLALDVLAKPAGAACNLACAYCYYLDEAARRGGGKRRMADDVLERYLEQLAAAYQRGRVPVSWQGGEPTLLGLDFYRRVVELEQKLARPGLRFENHLQTNGTLLDDDWGRFLAEHRFLVGVSLDGPRALHDAYRVDRGGRPTFDAAMRGLRVLRRHGVEHNVLCTVNRRNADHPLDVYRFFRDEVRTTWLQLIPVVEWEDVDRVSSRSVRPDQLGRFLCSIFDEWVRRDVGRVFVQTFEAALRSWVGAPATGVCVFDETCGGALVLEHDGNVYSCDHFVDEAHLLGNLRERGFVALASSPSQVRFGRAKLEELPRECLDCEVLFACHGECPKNRLRAAAGGERGLNYLCEAYRSFFRHVDGPMRLLADACRRGEPVERVVGRIAAVALASTSAERNDPCPCGSGKKRKRCHPAGG